MTRLLTILALTIILVPRGFAAPVAGSFAGVPFGASPEAVQKKFSCAVPAKKSDPSEARIMRLFPTYKIETWACRNYSMLGQNGVLGLTMLNGKFQGSLFIVKDKDPAALGKAARNMANQLVNQFGKADDNSLDRFTKALTSPGTGSFSRVGWFNYQMMFDFWRGAQKNIAMVRTYSPIMADTYFDARQMESFLKGKIRIKGWNDILDILEINSLHRELQTEEFSYLNRDEKANVAGCFTEKMGGGLQSACQPTELARMIKDLWLDPDRSTKRYQVAESQCYQSYAKEMKDQKTALRNCAKSVLQKALAARSQKTPQQQEPTAKVRSSSEDTAGELQPVSYEDAFGPEKPE